MSTVDPPSPPKAEEKEQPTSPKPGAVDDRYKDALPAVYLRLIAISCLVLAFALVGLCLINPLHFEDNVARFVFCVSMAMTLSVFFYVFYPENVELHLPLGLGQAVRVGGPIALWFIVLFALWRNFPTPEYGRVFRVMKDGQYGGMFYGDETTTYLTTKDAEPPRHLLIKNNRGNRLLYGIYVEFPPNVGTIEALLHHKGWEDPIPVKFTRTDKPILDVSQAKEKSLW